MRAFKNIFQARPQDSAFRSLKRSSQRLVIEIGCGVGLHPIKYAQTHPDDFIIAIEKTQEKFAKFAGRLKQHAHIPNLYPVHANATHWIPQHIQANEVDKYFILYPNPYPKAKQANKRFMMMPFMAYLIETMKTGAEIELATNALFYYEQAKAVMQNTWQLALIKDCEISNENTGRTHFERKYLGREEVCYSLQFKKCS